MKKMLIMLVMVFVMLGCSEDKGGSGGIAEYQISGITQGYNNNASITGTLTNTGGVVMTEIMVIALVDCGSEVKTLIGATEKVILNPGESTEFYITSTIGAYDIRLSDNIEYRVYHD